MFSVQLLDSKRKKMEGKWESRGKKIEQNNDKDLRTQRARKERKAQEVNAAVQKEAVFENKKTVSWERCWTKNDEAKHS